MQKDDYSLWTRDNDNFHNYIHTISRSHVLLDTIQNLRNRLYRFRILRITKDGMSALTP